MKPKQVLLWLCILLVGVNAFAAVVEKKSSSSSTTLVNSTAREPIDKRTFVPTPPPHPAPAIGETTEPPVVSVEGHTATREPDRSTGEPICPEGYYCKAVLRGTSVYCQWGEGIKECNSIAACCQGTERCMIEFDKYCRG